MTDCSTCVCLRTERDLRQVNHTMAIMRIRAAEISGRSADECLKLRAQEEEAKANLDLVQEEIMQHWTGHVSAEGHIGSEPFRSEPPADSQLSAPLSSPVAHDGPLLESSPMAVHPFLTFGIWIFALTYFALIVWFLRMIYIL